MDNFMYCLANTIDEYVYGDAKEVKNYVEEHIHFNWRLQFFPKKKLLLDVVEIIKEEEGKTVIELVD